MASTVDFRTHVDQSCRYSEEFVNIYYDCMDKKRRHLTRLYLDKATLVWNGNAVSGHDALGEFFESLPSSEFQVHTLDCQPVHGKEMSRPALMVSVYMLWKVCINGLCLYVMYYFSSLWYNDPCKNSFSDQATQGQTTLLVVTGGSVKFDGNKQHYFNQNFLLTAQASPTSDQPVWKIASDCFRFQDWAS
uniref:Nuclear transport factor 2-like export factor 2 n=1 Tax=Paramormyrops kingsleyae TaxID=1676925 RepID=A0A3B3QGM5_9TELE